MLTTVVFDADETLVELPPAVTGGLVAVLEEMRRLSPDATGVSLADVESDWDAVYPTMSARPVTEIRRAALARSLARVGLQDHIEPIAALFFARRFALTRPYAGVPGLLDRLRSRYVLGFASNGSSHAARCGLAEQFAFEVYAHVDGLPPKPSPVFFARIADAAGCRPESIVHVGDSYAKDVVPALAAGMRAVWLNRRGERRPDGPAPHAELATLDGLPAVLAGLD